MALSGMHHLLVLTDDLEASRRFYCDVLGFQDGYRPPIAFAGHWLYLDGVACVHLADRAEYTAHVPALGLDVRPEPLDHVAFAAAGFDELLRRLGEAGVEVAVNPIPGTGMRQLYFDDPNGFRLELNFPDG